jgi:hypothetical protein
MLLHSRVIEVLVGFARVVEHPVGDGILVSSVHHGGALWLEVLDRVGAVSVGGDADAVGFAVEVHPLVIARAVVHLGFVVVAWFMLIVKCDLRVRNIDRDALSLAFCI